MGRHAAAPQSIRKVAPSQVAVALAPSARKSVYAMTTLGLTGALLLTASLPANAQELSTAKSHTSAVSSFQRIDTATTAAPALHRAVLTASAAPQTAQQAPAAPAPQAQPAAARPAPQIPKASTVSVAQVASGSSILATAFSLIGTPYVWGGTTPAGFDCSGFVQYVFAQNGISLPRTSEAQTAAGTRISAAQARPGDLVSWGYHIGIYLGNGKMIDAPRPGGTVGVHAVWGSPVYVRIG